MASRGGISLPPRARGWRGDDKALGWSARAEGLIRKIRPVLYCWRRTRTGTSRLVVVPSPSWPAKLLPQQATDPSVLRAQEWLPPAATCFTPTRLPPRPSTTVLGAATFSVVLLPTWPFVSRPQHCTEPEVVTAQVCASREERDTDAKFGTATGTELLVVDVPTPSSPSALSPQQNVPWLVIVHVDDRLQLIVETPVNAWPCPSVTSTGVALALVVPSPSSPYVLLPQHFAPPPLI